MPANQDKNISIPEPLPVPKSFVRGFVKYWMPVIIYAALIFNISSVPGKDIPLLFAYQDIAFHIIEYSILAFLINRALKRCSHPMPRMRRFWLVFLLAVAYAASDELHQSFVPNRFASLYDLSYDAIGIFIANIFYR